MRYSDTAMGLYKAKPMALPEAIRHLVLYPAAAVLVNIKNGILCMQQ